MQNIIFAQWSNKQTAWLSCAIQSLLFNKGSHALDDGHAFEAGFDMPCLVVSEVHEMFDGDAIFFR